MSSSYDIKCKVIEEELRSVWPEWHVVDRLGGGTFGDVYHIYRDNYGIRVDSALKVIQVSSGMGTVDMSFNGQNDRLSDIPDSLRSEIQIMEALRGAPNIVAIEDFAFKRDGSISSLFVRMELLTSLPKVMSGRTGYPTLFSIREICKLGRDICTALMYCEEKSIIHRDIKPANLFVDAFGNYKIGDFGVSKRMDTVHVARTMTGIGTISYMAPEIFQGHSYNNTVDIYALGLVLYQLLNNGRMPFLPADGTYTMQDVDNANYKRLHGTPVPSLIGKTVAGEPVSEWLDAVVRKACAVDPADRYRTAKQFYDALSYGGAEREKKEKKERERREEEEKKRQEEEKRKQRRKDGRKQQKEERNEGSNKSVLPGVLLPIIAVAALLVILTVSIFGPPEPGPVDPPEDSSTAGTGDTSYTEEESGSSSGEGDTADGSAEIVEIPDPVLKKAIQDALGIEDREITKADALSLTELRYSAFTLPFEEEKDKIKDISALSAFKNLTELELSHNQLSDISALSGLTNLETLILGNNQLSDISALSGLTNLKYLELNGNQLSDIRALSGLTNLRYLQLQNNQLSDISVLSGLTNLETLILDYNQLSDIRALSELTNLETLGLGDNRLSDISALSGLTNLKALYLWDNQLSDIRALSGLINLKDLRLHDNQLSDIRALSGLTNLKTLYLSGNPVLEEKSREEIMEVLSGAENLTDVDF